MTARGALFDSAKSKAEAPPSLQRDLFDGLRLGFISIAVVLAAAFFFSGIVHPLFALGSVEETVMDVLTRLLLLALPFVAYIAAASVARRYAARGYSAGIGLGIDLHSHTFRRHFRRALCFQLWRIRAAALAADDAEPDGGRHPRGRDRRRRRRRHRRDAGRRCHHRDSTRCGGLGRLSTNA